MTTGRLTTNSEKHGYKPTGRKPEWKKDFTKDPEVIVPGEKALLRQQAAE